MEKKHEEPEIKTQILRGLLGGVANVFGVTIFSPLDVLKIRFQTDGELMKGGVKKYDGIVSGGRTIIRQEGIRGLFKGSFI